VGDESTFGKGTVQVPRSLADYLPYFSSREGAGMIKVTVQKFYRINGASTQLKGVESDIVLPMSTAALQLGEGELDFVMPYDEIQPAAGYVKDGRLARIMPELQRRSAARVAADNDLQYSKWYIENHSGPQLFGGGRED
jgi:carboxyl-terminal processing protease